MMIHATRSLNTTQTTSSKTAPAGMHYMQAQGKDSLTASYVKRSIRGLMTQTLLWEYVITR